MAVSLARFATMDPYILVSAVNMQLRDEFSSVEDLCGYHDIDPKELKAALKKKGFKYDAEQNQFK